MAFTNNTFGNNCHNINCNNSINSNNINSDNTTTMDTEEQSNTSVSPNISSTGLNTNKVKEINTSLSLLSDEEAVVVHSIVGNLITLNIRSINIRSKNIITPNIKNSLIVIGFIAINNEILYGPLDDLAAPIYASEILGASINSNNNMTEKKESEYNNTFDNEPPNTCTADANKLKEELWNNIMSDEPILYKIDNIFTECLSVNNGGDQSFLAYKLEGCNDNFMFLKIFVRGKAICYTLTELTNNDLIAKKSIYF